MKLDDICIEIRNYKNILSLVPNKDGERNQDGILLLNKKINLIVGDNNIGKTNLLMGISKLDLEQKNIKRYTKNDKPNNFNFSDDDRWSFKLSFDLPNLFAFNLVNDSKKFNADELTNCKNDLINLTKFFVNFSGKINAESEVGTYYSDILPNQKSIYNAKKEYFDNDFFQKVTQKFYPKIIDLIDDSSFSLNPIVFSKQDIENKNQTFKILSDTIKAFAADSYEEIIKDLKWLKSPKSSSDIETNIGVNEERKRIIKKINDAFSRKIDEIFEPFKNLHCKLKIELDGANDILPSISHDNYQIISKDTNNQGKGVIKLIKLIYLINLCCANKDQNHLLLIDEIENNLSINTQASLLMYLKNILKNNDNLFIVLTTHSPIFFRKNDDEKYDDYLNVICCSQTTNDGLQSFSILNLDETLSVGFSTDNNKNLKDCVDVLSYLLDADRETINKLFGQNLSH